MPEGTEGTDYKGAIDRLLASERKATLEECIAIVERYRESSSRLGRRDANRTCGEIALELRALAKEKP